MAGGGVLDEADDDERVEGVGAVEQGAGGGVGRAADEVAGGEGGGGAAAAAAEGAAGGAGGAGVGVGGFVAVGRGGQSWCGSGACWAGERELDGLTRGSYLWRWEYMREGGRVELFLLCDLAVG